MADRDVDRTGGQGSAPGPWWAGLGTWGAAVLIAFGSLVAAWVFFRLPGTPQQLAPASYGVAKVIAIGLVAVEPALLSRRRNRSSSARAWLGSPGVRAICSRERLPLRGRPPLRA